MLKKYKQENKKRDKMLIADDVQLNRVLLGQMFQWEHEIIEAEDGQDAISKLMANLDEIAIVLLDIKMPVLDGFAVMEFMKENGYMAQIPVILITSDEDGDAMERGYSLNASDVVLKPFQANVVIQRVNNVLELYRYKAHLEELVKEQTEELSRQYEKLKEHHSHLIGVLQDVVEYRNVESLQHIDYVQGYTKILADYYARIFPKSRMTPEKIDYIVRAAKWHDIGKIAMPDSVLSRTGHLSKWELELIKEHTTKGGNIMSVVTELEDEEFQRICYNVCMFHHEKYDRSGYPGTLRKERIPIEAQIVGLADMYEVLRHSYGCEDPYTMLMDGACGDLFPRMKDCLTAARKELAAYQI